EDADGSTRFPDALDFFGRIKHEISLSTAAHNAARFPFIDAAATLTLDTGVKNDRLIDGGYFENFSALTARDLAFSLADAPAENGRPEFVFVVIQISSDPDLKNTTGRNAAWGDKMGLGLKFAGDLDTPLAGLWNVRDGHG